MNLRCGEPRLNDLLADSIVRAVMEADGVDPRELKAQLRRTAAVLNAARSKRPAKTSTALALLARAAKIKYESAHGGRR